MREGGWEGKVQFWFSNFVCCLPRSAPAAGSLWSSEVLHILFYTKTARHFHSIFLFFVVKMASVAHTHMPVANAESIAVRMLMRLLPHDMSSCGRRRGKTPRDADSSASTSTQTRTAGTPAGIHIRKPMAHTHTHVHIHTHARTHARTHIQTHPPTHPHPHQCVDDGCVD